MRAPPLYDERRAAQAAAYLLNRAGGRMSLLALTKLLYLAERLSLERFAEPLTGDALVSMQHGPVLSRTLDLTRGLAEPTAADGWDAWIADVERHMVALRPGIHAGGEEELPALSRADIQVLADTWDQHGHLCHDPWALVKWCHTHCQEWEDPGMSSSLIPLRRLLRAVGYSDEQIESAEQSQAERIGLERTFAA